MRKSSSFWQQFVLAFFTFLTITAQGQEGNSLLWKISGNELETPSYLFGTMHVSDSVIHALVTDSLTKVIGSCDVFLSELSFAELENVDQGKMMNAIMMPGDTTLEDFYSEEEYEEMTDFFAKNMGIGAMMVPKMKPFYTLATLQQLQMMGDSAMAVEMENSGEKPVLDNLLSNVADSWGLELKGLETVDEQFAAIDKIPLEKQAESLKYYIENHDNTDEEAEDLFEAYASQNLEKVQRIVRSDMREFELIEKPLLEERNKIMLDRLIEYLDKNNLSVFCAVGLLHLLGDSGLILQLREEGYTVEPIGF